MKLKISLTLAAASLAIGGVANAATFTATSDTFGYVTLNTGSNGDFTFINLPMQATPSATGSITVSGSDLTISDFSVAPGTFSATNPAYAEVVAGVNVGARSDVTSNSATGVTVADATDFTDGDIVEIKLHNTLDSVFGDTTGTVIVAPGANANVADNVLVFNSSLQAFETYFFNSSPSPVLNGWRGGIGNLPTDDQGNVVIPPNGGVGILRRGGTAVEIVQSGRVQANEAELNLNADFTQVASNFPAGATLDEAFGGTTGTVVLQPGANANVADNVLIFNDSLQAFETYFFNSSPSPVLNGWRGGIGNLPTDDQGGEVVFGPGQSLIILRRSGALDLSDTEPAGLQ